MGAHTANPTSGDFSVTSSHILKIENGEIVGALKQAGISGNLPRSLATGVILGDNPLPHGGWGGGSVYVPDTLLRDGVRVNPA
jgi:PmbA protein